MECAKRSADPVNEIGAKRWRGRREGGVGEKVERAGGEGGVPPAIDSRKTA